MFDASKSYAVLGLARSGIAAAKKIKELGGTAFLSDAQKRDKISGAAEWNAILNVSLAAIATVCSDMAPG